MTIWKTEGNVNSDWLVYEDDDAGRYSRENVVIAASQTVKAGQPLEWADAGKTSAIAMVDGTAGNGFAGIAVSDVTTAAGQTVKAAVIARHARVVFEKLYFPPATAQGIKDNTKAAITAGAPSIVFQASDNALPVA